MKHSSIYFLVIICALWSCRKPAEVKTSGNPVFEGWYADPEGIIYDDTYWIYPTWSDKYENQTFFDCFSSKDLINWTKHASILDTAEVKWAKQAMWAPSVIRKDGKYYFFFGANDVHEGETGGIGLAVSDRPEGPYKDLLGKPLINEIVNGAQPIDQFVFRDEDDTYYLYYGGWGHCNIVRLNDDFTALRPFEDGEIYKEVTPENYVEGPFMFKKDGKYYLMMSGCSGWAPNEARSAVANSIWGPWEELGNPCVGDDAELTFHSQSTYILPVQGKTNTFIYIGDRWRPSDAIDGRYIWLPIVFRDAGFIIEWKDKWGIN